MTADFPEPDKPGSPATAARSPGMTGLSRFLLVVGLSLLSWLGMQLTHEFGHVLAAWSSGGKVVTIDLHPLHISRTDVHPNPHPVIERWGGPLFGVLFPVGLWLLSQLFRSATEGLWRFFAGACLIANGAYLGSGVFVPVGDALDLIREGEPSWRLALFGLICVPVGIWMWDGLATQLHLKPGTGEVPLRHLTGIWAILGLILAIELWWF